MSRGNPTLNRQTLQHVTPISHLVGEEGRQSEEMIEGISLRAVVLFLHLIEAIPQAKFYQTCKYL